MNKNANSKKKCIFLLIVFIIFFILQGFSCVKPEKKSDQAITIETYMPNTEEQEDAKLRDRAAQIASSMSDTQLASQVLITGIDGKGSVHHLSKSLLEELPAGGVMFFRFNLETDIASIKKMTEEVSSLIADNGGIPPFIAVDLEGGTVNRFSRNEELLYARTLPDAAIYRNYISLEGNEYALEKIYKDSFNAAGEISALGFNMNYAPVAEPLTDDNGEFLSDRSYGRDIDFVKDASSYFIKGMQENGIICVIKHFPCSAGFDPHYSESKIESSDNYYLSSILYPFEMLIKNVSSEKTRAKAIMMTHTKIPFFDNEIASLSSFFINDLLREKWGFNGIIICDDFEMSSASSAGLTPEQAAVKSLSIGANLIMVWPYNIKQHHDEIIAALEDKRLTRSVLQKACAQIIYEKLKLGLI